jgi:hypothetical protein
MLPVMEPGPPRRPKGLRPALVLKLKPGWEYSESEEVFRSPDGKELKPQRQLPRGSRIDYRVPRLAHRRRGTLSKEEVDLARFMHVVLPLGKEPSSYLAMVRKWPFVEEAYPAPDLSLP